MNRAGDQKHVEITPGDRAVGDRGHRSWRWLAVIDRVGDKWEISRGSVEGDYDARSLLKISVRDLRWRSPAESSGWEITDVNHAVGGRVPEPDQRHRSETKDHGDH